MVTNREKRKRILELREEINQLYASFRSDWHRGFEAVLRIDTYAYGDRVKISTEVELGADTPRADYLMLVDDAGIQMKKEIFRIFRRFNIIEYKNPNDSLNSRVIRKIRGYANLFIGTAAHEGEIPEDQVTLSIFRYRKNKTLFRKMEKEGRLKNDPVPGIYHVSGMTDLPFQIVIMEELQGAQYAAYRSQTEGADKDDIIQVLLNYRQGGESTVREYYQILLDLVTEKNAKTLGELERGGDSMAGDVLMELLKDRIDEKVNKAVSEEKEETRKANEAAQAAKEAAKAANEAEQAAKEDAQAAREEAQKVEEEQLNGIRNVMQTLSYTVDKAMELLVIPMEKRSSLALKLQEMPPKETEYRTN